jgi:hypothetical protein
MQRAQRRFSSEEISLKTFEDGSAVTVALCHPRFFHPVWNVLRQGCQICLATTYQNGKNMPNNYKMYQITTKCTK